MTLYGLIFVVFLGIVFLSRWVNILNEYERAVIFRLGRLLPETKGPGLVLIFWPIDKMVKISLRTVVHDVPSQDVITKDNVSVKVNAVVYFRVMDPTKAVVEVENYLFATSQMAQTTLRSVLGQAELDELLSEREKLNEELQTIIDAHTDPWGVKVSSVEVKHVDLPQEMQRAMAKQAEGEMQASHRLAEAANIISQNPTTLQLRYLQTLTEIAAEQNSTILFPIPIDLVKAFMPQSDN